MISIPKELLFQLMHSHSILAEAEYNRNKGYNSSHFSAKAEGSISVYLTPDQITEYFNYVDASNKD
jgi:hypothetical protein